MGPSPWGADGLRLWVVVVVNLVLALVGAAAPNAAGARVLGPGQRPAATAQAPAPATAVSAPGAPVSPRPAPLPVGSALPVSYAGSARQVITVKADCAACTSATLQAWDNLGTGRFMAVTGPVRAKIGARGVGAAYEGSDLTPLGTWNLPEAFGIQPNPGTRMPYFVAGPTDYWDGRSGLPTYNTHVRSSVPIEGENLLAAGWVYNYAVVMGVNPGRVPNGGSAFFLHVTDGRPTAGCVAIDQGSLVAILRWLDPAAHPQMVVAL